MTAPPGSSGSDIRAILHELGQPLSAILSNAQAAKRLLAADPPDVMEVRAALSDVITQSKQAARIFRRLEARLLRAESESGE